MGNRNVNIPWLDSFTGKLHKRENGPVICGIGPKTGWYDWLERGKSFHYEGIEAAMTVRPERRQRGGLYWYGWRTIEGQKHKKYIGVSRSLTLQKLEEVAIKLAQIELKEAAPETEQDQWKHKPRVRQPQHKRKYEPVLPEPEPATVQTSFFDI